MKIRRIRFILGILGLSLSLPLAPACDNAANPSVDEDIVTVPDNVTVEGEDSATFTEGSIPDPSQPLSETVEAALSFTPDALTYELPVALEGIEYLPQIQSGLGLSLTQGQLEKLSANGVLAVPGQQYERFEDAYERIGYGFSDGSAEPPLLITSDSMLHMYHLFFDQLLKFSEIEEFIAMLDLMVPGMAQASSAQQAVLEGDLAEAARRNKAFFLVAARLLNPEATLPADVKDEVEAELELIAKAEGLKPSPIFNQDCPESCNPCDGLSQLDCKDFVCLCEDYSQYVPRGHYTQSEDLKRYFKAMMWLGRISLRLKSDMETTQAMLATDALKSVSVEYNGQELAASELWLRIYKVTSFFVGKADDLTFYDYDVAAKTALGDTFELTDLALPAKLASLKEELDKLRSPRILGGFVAALLDETAETKGWRFMGLRFAPDSYVLGQMVWDHVDPDLLSSDFTPAVEACMAAPEECVEITPEVSDCICFAGLQLEPGNAYGVCRLLPRGLDVMAAMGSATAGEILAQDARFCGFQEQLTALTEEFSQYQAEDWTQNAYWAWLNALRPLLASHGEGWPVWMQTRAWQLKQLNTSMTSWAQLRHDTILYVKQSYTPAVSGTGMPLEFGGYVEPVPEFYHRLAFLSRYTRDGLNGFGLLPEGANEAMIASEELLTKLRDISQKELSGTELTSEDQDVILHISDTLTGIITQLAGSVTVQETSPDCEGEQAEEYYCITETNIQGDAFKTTLVADVHTDGNTRQVLEVASGKLDWIIVIHKTLSGQLVASIGPIFTYYEFPHPMNDRLTDEAWRSMLDSGSVERPEWISEIY